MDSLLHTLRDRLKQDRVELWKPPYHGDENCDRNIKELCAEYAEQLKLQPTVVYIGLKELQHRAVSKLEAREHFATTGVATLQVSFVAVLAVRFRFSL